MAERILNRVPSIRLLLPLVVSLGACGCSSSEGTEPDAGGVSTGSVDGGGAKADAATSSTDAASMRPTSSADASLPSIPLDSPICGASLPFKPPGCSCSVGQTSPCWTGPADQRNARTCKDGVQTCVPEGEFGRWGDCLGEVKDCPPPDPPPPVCSCIPGKVVSCDEDCTAGVICAPFSTKECQPDGSFGPCRESLVPTHGVVLVGCSNLFHGCFGNDEGQWTGDCSDVFTCGKAPGQLN